ncbi:hypothetical protein FQN50_001485 [Emmonsiellopsis sp. PD_5]|nr:hypothetical protein FQN50_001485 [Emmonsiellopsis sp. PD_5]
MSKDFKNIIVLAPSGAVGPVMIDALTNSPHGYSVSTLSRETSTYTPPTGVTGIKSDFTHDSLVQALKGQDTVVSAIAGVALLEQIKVIDAAIEAGVRRFIPSEYGGDSRNKHAQSLLPFYAMKTQVWEYLVERQDKIEWTAFNCGPFLDTALKAGLLGFDIPSKTVTFWDPRYTNAKFSATRLDHVARAVAQSLSPTYSAQAANQFIVLRDATFTLATLLKALEEATGGEKWTRNEADLDVLIKESTEKMGKGDFSGIPHIITGLMVDEGCGNDFDEAGRVNGGLVGVEDGLTLKEVVEGIVREVKGE